MDDVVRRIIEPFTILNLGVCCVRARRKAESSNDIAIVIAAYITVAQLDVSLYRFTGGISLWPLRRVAGRPHEVPCRGDDFQHPMDVFFGGLPYCQLHIFAVLMIISFSKGRWHGYSRTSRPTFVAIVRAFEPCRLLNLRVILHA